MQIVESWPCEGACEACAHDTLLLEAVAETEHELEPTVQSQHLRRQQLHLCSPAVPGARMLLTSARLTSPAITAALADLLGKPLQQARIVVIKTAASGDDSLHDWLMTDHNRLHALGSRTFQLLDINGPPTSWTLDVLGRADVIYLGGNAYHLAHSIHTSGLTGPLLELMESKVFAGASAGSMIFAQDFTRTLTELLGRGDAIFQARGCVAA